MKKDDTIFIKHILDAIALIEGKEGYSSVKRTVTRNFESREKG